MLEISALRGTVCHSFRNISSIMELQGSGREEGAGSLHWTPSEATASTELLQTCGMTSSHFWSLSEISSLTRPVASCLWQVMTADTTQWQALSPSEEFLSSWGWLVRNQLPRNRHACENFNWSVIVRVLLISYWLIPVSHASFPWDGLSYLEP